MYFKAYSVFKNRLQFNLDKLVYYGNCGDEFTQRTEQYKPFRSVAARDRDTFGNFLETPFT